MLAGMLHTCMLMLHAASSCVYAAKTQLVFSVSEPTISFFADIHSHTSSATVAGFMRSVLL